MLLHRGGRSNEEVAGDFWDLAICRSLYGGPDAVSPCPPARAWSIFLIHIPLMVLKLFCMLIAVICKKWKKMIFMWNTEVKCGEMRRNDKRWICELKFLNGLAIAPAGCMPCSFKHQLKVPNTKYLSTKHMWFYLFTILSIRDYSLDFGQHTLSARLTHNFEGISKLCDCWRFLHLNK